MTKRGVRVGEVVSRLVITVGGIGTIAAVGLICFFLVGVALPLFAPAEATPRAERELPAEQRPLGFAVDDLQRIAWSVLEDGRLVATALHDGSVLIDEPLFGGARPAAAAFPVGAERAIFGFADGSVRLARIGIAVSYLDLDEAPSELAALDVGDVTVLDAGVVERISPEQLRLEQVVRDVDALLPTSFDGPIAAVALARVPKGLHALVADESGAAALVLLRETKNMLTGASTLRPSRHALPARGSGSGEPARGAPRFAAVSGSGGSAWLAWEDGALVRYDLRTLSAPLLVEENDLVPEPGERLECLTTLLGQTTLISGDSLGRVRGWFLARRTLEDGSERVELVLAHDLERGPGPVVALAVAERSRSLAAAYAGGAVRVFNVTNDEEILALDPPEPVDVRALALAPRQDGIFLWGARGLFAWDLDLGHPEASPAALFREVWYEGHPEPAHVWQSSSGTDDFEPKLGLVPLVFGTLKATLYSMLFGVPLALLAALYTSEFLQARWKSGVKSSIEMMASLPSVVLGFLAALVIAPFVQGVLSAVLASFFTIPVVLLLGARLWQLLPRSTQIRLSGTPRMASMALALPLGILAARVVGPFAERALFGGDLVAWLDGGPGGAEGGWTVLLVPLAALALTLASRPVDGWLRRRAQDWSERAYASAELGRFVLQLAVTLVVALLGGEGLALAGFDPRGSLVGTYVQRNALIVGFAMGFAIVPIIYTLAEDALASVPDHLRQASLGAGATPWQTAMRVVVPTAMSGLFSALMIGLGRAVGETMIVLMATGNTPIMEWNAFNGFRTLSANLAVELPEAVQGDTHYRTLFLAALVLFGMTFVLNTFAEIVRQRFRKRAWQL